MTAKELRDAIKAEPFLPFRLRFGSGQTVKVPHPEFIALSPSGRTAVIFTEKGSFEAGSHMQIVDVLLIEAIEFLSGRGNGQGRRGTKK